MTPCKAVTRVRPRQPLVFGNAVVALNPNADWDGNQDGITIHGTPDTNVVFNEERQYSKPPTLELWK